MIKAENHRKVCLMVLFLAPRAFITPIICVRSRMIIKRPLMSGVMKALGARNKTIRHTFLWFSAFIIGQGLLLGNVLGAGIIAIQKYTGLVKLDPQTYYVSEAPMEVNIPLFVLLNIATLIICVFVLIAPSYLISHIHPAKSMRYE